MVEAVFLDRDGVINEEVEYLHDPKDLRLIPGAARAIRMLNELKIPVIVVTNQAGVARGYYPESQVAVLHEALSQELEKEGAHIDRFYYCPHHRAAGKGKYAVDCDCRKPKPGLLAKAAKDLGLNLSRCVVIGDKASDLGAGVSAGCRTILVMSGYGKEQWTAWDQPFQPHHVALDLRKAVEWLLQDSTRPVL